MFLEISQNSQENTCARVSFLIKACNFIKKETLAQVLSCKFCEIFKKTFFTEHLWATASKKVIVILVEKQEVVVVVKIAVVVVAVNEVTIVEALLAAVVMNIKVRYGSIESGGHDCY